MLSEFRMRRRERALSQRGRGDANGLAWSPKGKSGKERRRKTTKGRGPRLQYPPKKIGLLEEKGREYCELLIHPRRGEGGPRGRRERVYLRVRRRKKRSPYLNLLRGGAGGKKAYLLPINGRKRKKGRERLLRLPLSKGKRD